jgi:hypothetical protein
LFCCYAPCQVKQTTASIGASVNVSQVGSDLPSTTAPASLSPLGGTKDWQPTVTVDEDGILNQLRGALLQSRNAPVGKLLVYSELSFCNFACLYISINLRRKGFLVWLKLVYASSLVLTSNYFFPPAQTFGSPQQPQSNPLLPAIQACIDAITEHQRLNALMKGELIKGLLPQSTVRADYTVHRVQGEAFNILSEK